MLVSVITPTYNRANRLPRAAQSVYEQSYENIEYVVVDDGSADETEAVVGRFEHDELKYVKNDEKMGVSAARNRGVEAADGDAVLFLDSDDVLNSSAIEVLVSALCSEQEKCAGAFGREAYCRDGEVKKRSKQNREKYEYQDLLKSNCVGAFGGKLIKRHVFDDVGEIDTAMPSSEDFDFFLRLAKEGYYLRGIDEVTYYKIQHAGQISAATYNMLKGNQIILSKYADDLTPRHRAQRLYRIAHILAKNEEMGPARRYFGRCLLTYPFRATYYLYLLTSLGGYRTYKYAHEVPSVIRDWK